MPWHARRARRTVAHWPTVARSLRSAVLATESRLPFQHRMPAARGHGQWVKAGRRSCLGASPFLATPRAKQQLEAM